MKKEINKMVRDEHAYIESIGKQDRETVHEALRDGGENAVLRVCLGATTETMPLRVLGYAASAQVVQARYFPNAQLQFVYPLHAAEAANGVPVDQSKPHAERFDFDRLNIGSQGDGEITGLIDTPSSIDAELSGAVQEILATHTDVAEPLLKAANRRQGDAAAYVAAHLVMHDSSPMLLPLDPMSQEARPAKRIISIGAQSERMFYAARMTCRQAGVLPDGAIAETGQLFTRHVLPPYLHCRQGGEPTLDDYYDRTRPAHAFDTRHLVPSVERDLQFLSSHLYGLSPEGFLSAECTL